MLQAFLRDGQVVNTRRDNIRTSELASLISKTAEDSSSACAQVRAVYVRRESGDWRFLLGRVSWVSPIEQEFEEYYSAYAFVSKCVSRYTSNSFFEALEKNGYQITPNVPRIAVTSDSACWSEQLVPSNMTGTGFPSRRFSARIEKDASFVETALIGYNMPFYRSSAARITQFLDLCDFHGFSDARKGELLIEIPDKRAAIHLEGNCLSIREAQLDVSLVGQINDEESISLVRGESCTVDTDKFRNIELWLVTKENEILDYRSSSAWPYRHEMERQSSDYEVQLKNIILKGESETSEFKVYIDLTDHDKASEIERTVCAFSNLRGGQLFIGITDEGEVAGLAKGLSRLKTKGHDNACAIYVANINKRLREALKDNQSFRTEAVTIYAELVVVVTVDPSPEVNYLLKSSLAYIRRGATNRKMTPAEITAQGSTGRAWNL